MADLKVGIETSQSESSREQPAVKESIRLLRIGEAAARSGVSVRTLRYYEELNLVRPAVHSPRGSRRYGEREIARVVKVRELQDLMGLNLEEIRVILAGEDRIDMLREVWNKTDELATRRAVLLESIEIMSARRTRMTERANRIAEFVDELDERLARAKRYLSDIEEF